MQKPSFVLIRHIEFPKLLFFMFLLFNELTFLFLPVLLPHVAYRREREIPCIKSVASFFYVWQHLEATWEGRYPYLWKCLIFVYFCTDDELEDNPNQSDLIEQAAEMLYGLIHARYIMTNRGIAQMVSLGTSHVFYLLFCQVWCHTFVYFLIHFLCLCGGGLWWGDFFVIWYEILVFFLIPF